MTRQFTGGVPSTIDNERLRNVLDLGPGDRRLLGAHLHRNHPGRWPAQGLDEQGFYLALRQLIADPTGIQAWEAAARSVGGHQRGDRLSLKVRIDRALAYRVGEALGGDAYLAVASDLPGQRRSLRERLRQAKQWSTLAELLWADLINDRDSEGALEAIADTPDIHGLLEEILTGPPPVEEPAAPPAEGWQGLVAELKQRAGALDGEVTDIDGARAVLASALALVEAAEQAEAMEIKAREEAFTEAAGRLEALQGEGLLPEALARARERLPELARDPVVFQPWINELEEALTGARAAIDDKQKAQQAFRAASSEAIEDIARIEGALSALKEARTRSAARIERLNALLSDPVREAAEPEAATA
jgi:hypothetical protein